MHLAATNRVAHLVIAFGLAVLGVGCGDDELGDPRTTSSTETAETSNVEHDDDPVTVTSDLRFAEASPDMAPWSEPLLDVYAPQHARDLPLVVILPPHSFSKSNPSTIQVANAIAGRGAMVVVANWSQEEDPPATFVSLAEE